MAESDSAFKLMMDLSPQDIVSRLIPGAEYIRTLSIELPREPLRADALLLIRLPRRIGETEGRLCIVHIEVQSSADATMPRRLCEYVLLAYQREKLPVISIVIYLEKCATPTSPWTVPGLDGDILTFHFQVVRLWEEPVEEWLQAGQVALMPFVPLLMGATIASIEPAIAKLKAIESVGTRGSALNYLLFFASRTFGEELLTKYLEDHHMLSEPYIIESPWYQYILRKGEHNGEIAGLREAIAMLAARRFPALEADLRATLSSITDPAQLRDLVVLVGTAPDEAAVRQGLPSGE